MKKTLTLVSLLLCLTGLQAQNKVPEKLYGVKSAIVKTVTTTGDQKSYDTRWIDDYGQKEKSVTTMDMGPEFGLYKATTLLVGDDAWLINSDDKAKKMEGRPFIDWRNLSEKDIKAFEVKDLGTEEYKGKTCQVYSYKQKQLLTKVTITIWLWEGLVIRQHIKKKMSESWIELESLQVNVPIPKGTFDIPKEYD